MEQTYLEIIKELDNSDKKYGPMQEMVEGLHTLKCEVSELEREVMRQNKDYASMKREAIQVGAMAFKFLRDILEDKQ